MSLCTSFQEAARWTWNQLGRSTRLKAPFNEETITETILLELKDNHPRDIAVVSFSKIQERKIGADWEFWFLDRSGARGVGWRVQAKRLYQPHQRYDALKPADTSPSSQIQTLIQMAGRQGLAPIYCFYNFVPNPHDIKRTWRCGSFVPDHELFGCSIARADNVRAVAANDFASVCQISLPWHCTVCCTALGSGDDLPDRVAGVTQSLQTPGASEEFASVPTDDLPRHVQIMLESQTSLEGPPDTEELERALYEWSGARDFGTGGIALFRDSTVD